MKKTIVIPVIVVLLLALAITAYASTGTVSKNITYRNIRIMLNGETVTPEDANGTRTEPFVMDGKTYIPIRAFAEALGIKVDWDNETSTVMLSSAPGSASLSTYWSEGSTASQSLTDYVAKVTDPKNTADFIPVKDRIAVFDMDGTLTCETFYTYYDTMMFIEYCLYDHPERVSDELKQVAASIQPGYTAGEALARDFAKAYAGMTVEELYDYAVAFGKKYTESFNNMRYIDGFYLPMVELVRYLYENGFTIYVVSGTERTTTRAIVANSPIRDYVTPNHVIGTEFEVKQRGHEDESSNMNYKYADGDELVFTGGFVQKNLNANKSIDIEQEIGQRPVLAFGNSGSDTSMMNYAIDSRNPYPAQAYMIVADDDVREWGTQDWEKKSAEYRAMGYVPVSMKDDFAQIYPEGISKAETQYQERDWSDADWNQASASGASIDFAAVYPSWNPESASLNAVVDSVTEYTDKTGAGGALSKAA